MVAPWQEVQHGLLETPIPVRGNAEAAAVASDQYADLSPEQGWMSPSQLPICYNAAANIRFCGVERCHPFDSCKYEKVAAHLQRVGVLTEDQLVQHGAVRASHLRDVHSDAHIQALKHDRMAIARACEFPPALLLPICLLQSRLMRPMRVHVAGTMLAAALALERGWAVHIGGGMHHAWRDGAAGWCCWDDIMLATRAVRRRTHGAVQQVLVVDLDAHQGNGVARDKLLLRDSQLRILDAFNCRAFPDDGDAKAGIDVCIQLRPGCEDEEYLRRVAAGLTEVLDVAEKPQLMIYNAGSDVLDGDPLGGLAVSGPGVLRRDEMVFRAAAAHGIPLVMLLSGGYAKEPLPSAAVISQSLTSLIPKLIAGQE